MSVPLTYPGVYIEEIPSGVRSITGVATSITAFIGSSLRGEENEPILVQSFAEYTRNFGELSRNHPLGFTVRQFFLNGGRDALIVRVSGVGSAAATLLDGTLDLRAASSGAWGDHLSVTVTHPDPLINPDAAANEVFNIIFTDSATGEVETFNNVSALEDNSRYATTILEQQSKLARVNGALANTRPGPVSDLAFDTTAGDDGIAITTRKYLTRA